MPTSSSTPSGNTGRNRPPGETSEARIAKALAHPLRARILQRLGERVASPGDLAVELGAPLGVVSYHVRMLRDYDCVELVRTEPRRGALQHFYRATARPNLDDDQWRTLPSGLRGELTGETLTDLVTDLGAAADAGHLQDPEVILNRTPLELDEKAFKKLNKLLAKTQEQALAIAEESATRHNDGGHGRVPDRARRPALQARRLNAEGPAERRGPRRVRYGCGYFLAVTVLEMVLPVAPLTLMTTFGAFFRRLDDLSFIVTLPLPDLVVVFLEPAIRIEPVSLALAAVPEPSAGRR